MQTGSRHRSTSLFDDMTFHDQALRTYQLSLEERQCRTPAGIGVVEKVYQRRGMMPGILGCKVIMDNGTVKYFDIADVEAV